MTDKQRKNLVKMCMNAMQENEMKAVQEVAHVTRMMYEAYLDEGFSDEQAMFLTTSVLMAGGME